MLVALKCQWISKPRWTLQIRNIFFRQKKYKETFFSFKMKINSFSFHTRAKKKLFQKQKNIWLKFWRFCVLAELTFFPTFQSTIFQDTCLNATAAFLARVIETGRFVELIENKHETRDIGTYITPEMASILNQVSLASAYKTAREIFQLRQRHSYAKVTALSHLLISWFPFHQLDKKRRSDLVGRWKAMTDQNVFRVKSGW